MAMCRMQVIYLTCIFHGNVPHASDVLPIFQLQFGIGDGIPVEGRVKGYGEFVDGRPNEANVFLLRLELPVFPGLPDVLRHHFLQTPEVGREMIG